MSVVFAGTSMLLPLFRKAVIREGYPQRVLWKCQCAVLEAGETKGRNVWKASTVGAIKGGGDARAVCDAPNPRTFNLQAEARNSGQSGVREPWQVWRS